MADDDALRVCLERTVELDNVRLRLRDWPGLRGPLVHVPDPLARPDDDSVVELLAAALAPRHRVVSLQPRGSSAYQVDAADLLAILDTFGFRTPVLLGERLGCVPALLVAAWHAGRAAGLVLVDPVYDPPLSDSVQARALLDCPPDWPALRNRVNCPVLVLRTLESVVQRVGDFLGSAQGAC